MAAPLDPSSEPQRGPAAPHRASASAVVVSYRTGPSLLEAIVSLLAAPELGELILVDNGNPESLRARVAEIAAADARLLHRVVGRNIGFAAATNRGAREARYERLLLFNPDATLPAGGLARLLAEADALPRPWLLGCRILGEDGREQRGSRRGALTPETAYAELKARFGGPAGARFHRHEEPLPERTQPIATVSGACMLIPTADYRALGGLDERYFLHAEDVDLCRAIRRAGGGVHFAPAVAVTHIKGTSAAPALWVEWHKTRSLGRYFRKHFAETDGALAIGLLVLGLWLRFLLRAPGLSAAGRGR